MALKSIALFAFLGALLVSGVMAEKSEVDVGPAGRALKAVAGVNLVSTASEVAAMSETDLASAVLSYCQMPDGWDKTGRKLSGTDQAPCIGCANGAACTIPPWTCCKKGGDGQTCCSLGFFGVC